MHVAITYLSNTLIIQYLILVLFLSLESQAYHKNLEHIHFFIDT